MADKKDLPEGTDTVIAGASGSSSGNTVAGRSNTTNPIGGSSASNAGGARTGVTSSGSDSSDDLITGAGTSSGAANRGSSSGTGSESASGVRGMISTGASKVRDEAGTRARGLVGQGLERGSTTLTNISGIVSQTAAQLDEQLGSQYGDYARQAGTALERYANTLANKDPDELIDDARELVRKSPGVAIAGAAIVGFGLVRLIKAGLEENRNGDNRSGNRSR